MKKLLFKFAVLAFISLTAISCNKENPAPIDKDNDQDTIAPASTSIFFDSVELIPTQNTVYLHKTWNAGTEMYTYDFSMQNTRPVNSTDVEGTNMHMEHEFKLDTATYVIYGLNASGSNIYDNGMISYCGGNPMACYSNIGNDPVYNGGTQYGENGFLKITGIDTTRRIISGSFKMEITDFSGDPVHKWLIGSFTNLSYQWQ